MADLVPPDYKRCQAWVPTGGPFEFGGPPGDPREGYRRRCARLPKREEAFRELEARAERAERERDEAHAPMLRLADDQCIVSSNVLSPAEITQARADGRMYVTPNGLGFVRVRRKDALARKAEARAKNLACVLADAYGAYCEDNPDPDHCPEPWVEWAQELLGVDRCNAIFKARAALEEAPDGE